MPYALRKCGKCGSEFRPHRNGFEGECWPCRKPPMKGAPAQPDHFEPQAHPGEAPFIMGRQGICPADLGTYTAKTPGQNSHKGCKHKPVAERSAFYADWDKSKPLPNIYEIPGPTPAPLKTAVFDLETMTFDRGWGLVLCGVVLSYGDGGAPKLYTFRADDYESFNNGNRHDDSALVADVWKILEQHHVIVGHNSLNFDLPYLRSVSLKYGLPVPTPAKLIDPVQIWRKQFRTGSASLASIINFLGLEEEKTSITPEDWRRFVYSGHRDAGDNIVVHCQADVFALAKVAEIIAPYVGQLDNLGSFRAR